MATDLAMTQSFQEKLFERIRESVGDLMTDDDLKKLLDTTMQKAFFENRLDAERSNSYHTKYKEPAIVELVRGLLQEQVNKAVGEWVKDNPDEFAKAVDGAIAKGMFGLVQQHMDSMVSGPLYEFANRLRENGLNI